MRKSKTNKNVNVEMENQAAELLVEDLDNNSEIMQEEGIELENTEKVLEEVAEVEEVATEAVEEVVAEPVEAEEVMEATEADIAEMNEELDSVLKSEILKSEIRLFFVDLIEIVSQIKIR